MRVWYYCAMKRHRIAVFVVSLFFAVCITAIAAPENESHTLNFALSGSPDTLDPHKTSGTLTFQAIKSVYDTLVEPDAQGKLVPALAESWFVSDDSLTWTFRLRRGVKFHNGLPFGSADVKATLERVLSEDIASPHAEKFSAILSIETPDQSTLLLRLAEPFAPLLSTLASGWGAILPQTLIEADHDFGEEPVGTGPFRFVQWVRDSKIVFEKNPDYWIEDQPKLDMLVMNIILERPVQVQALLAGELDIIYNVNQEDLVALEKSPDTVTDRKLTALVMVIPINTSRPPFNDLRVRKAINHAIDKQTALDVAYGGGEVIGTFMDYNDPFYADFAELYPYDPEKARNLLKEAGVGEDVEISLTLPQNFEPHVRAGILYQEMLSKVGLKVNIRQVDWSTWIGDVYRGANYDLTVIGHTGKLDPHGRLGGPEYLYTKWSNSEAASLFDRAKGIVDFQERKALYRRGLEIMAQEVPFVFVGTSYRYIATGANISGFLMDQKLDTFDFRSVVKKR